MLSLNSPWMQCTSDQVYRKRPLLSAPLYDGQELNENQPDVMIFLLILSYPMFLANLPLSQNPYSYYHDPTGCSQPLYYGSLPSLA